MKVQVVTGIATIFAPGLLAFSIFPSFQNSDASLNARGLPDNLNIRVLAAETCTKTIAGDMFSRFTGIFFGDFTTTGGQDILGPLAVQGKFTASSYTVNSNHAGSCAHVDSSLDGYGLVVGGSVKANDVHVHGAIFVSSASDASGLQELDNSCPVVTNHGTGLFDFGQAYGNAIDASRKFAGYSPSLVLDPNDKLFSVGSKSDGYDVITFNTCNNQKCDLYPGKMSDPKSMLFGIGNWNGPKSMSFPQKLIINIPVSSGSTIQLSGNQPSMGITPCGTIYNFYPSDSSGKYSGGSIIVKRNTGGQLGGLTLAPEADIIDGSTGNFAGLTIGHDYSWSGSGVEIHDYNAAGGSCNGFSCFPVTNTTTPPYPGVSTTTTATSTSTSTSTTTTSPIATTTITTTTTTTTNSPTTTSSSSTTTDSSSTTTTSSATTASSSTTTTDTSSTTTTTGTPTTTSSSSTTTSSSPTTSSSSTTTTDTSSTTTTGSPTTTSSSSTTIGGSSTTTTTGTPTTTSSSTTTSDTASTTSATGTASTTTTTGTAPTTTTTGTASTTTTAGTPTTTSTSATTTCSHKHHSTTTCNHKHHKITTSCSHKHHKPTTTKHKKSTTTCDHKKKHHKTTTTAKHVKPTTTTCGCSLPKTTTTCDHKKKHNKTTTSIKHKKPTTTCDHKKKHPKTTTSIKHKKSTTTCDHKKKHHKTTTSIKHKKSTTCDHKKKYHKATATATHVKKPTTTTCGCNLPTTIN